MSCGQGGEKNMFFLYYSFFSLNKKNIFFLNKKKHVFFSNPTLVVGLPVCGTNMVSLLANFQPTSSNSQSYGQYTA